MFFVFLILIYILLNAINKNNHCSNNDVFIPFEDSCSCAHRGMETPHDNHVDNDF